MILFEVHCLGNVHYETSLMGLFLSAGQGSLASAPAAAPQASKAVAAASAPAPGSVTSASVGRRLLA